MTPICSMLCLLAATPTPLDLATPPPGLTVVGGRLEGDRLVVTNDADQPRVVPVLVLVAPFGEDAPRSYALAGTVETRGVKGRAYLELWNDFGADGRYFSRGLAEHGPMGHLEGDQAPRSFVLPFDPGRPLAPARLELNVAFPGRGTVVLSGLTLDGGGTHLGALAGWVGGLAGTALGLFGALAGWLASRGRQRRLVLGGALAMAGGSAGIAAVGVWLAMAEGSPLGGAYGWLLGGGIGVAVSLALWHGARRAYTAHELRRVQALDS